MKVAKFNPIPYSSFPFLPNEVINDLSTDQYYGYRMCWAIIPGEVDQDLDHLEIEPLNHSHWITFPCQTLRFNVSQPNSTNLCLITEFEIKAVFPLSRFFSANQRRQIIFGIMVTIALKNSTNLWKYDIRYTLLTNWYKI